MRLLRPRGRTYRRLIDAFGFFLTVLVMGAIAFHVVGDGRWGWFECFYMTVITVSTVGYAEVLPDMHLLPEARLVTMLLIILGSGTLLYFVSSLTAVIVEGDLGGILRQRRMQREIDKLNDHIIVCGIGTTGRHIIAELLAVKAPFVAIDHDLERIEDLAEEEGKSFHYVVGDATDDHMLERAGVERARGIIAALNDDKANVFVTISARALNAKARIVAKAIEPSTERKLRRAGANAVVSPNLIGGVRLVSEMVRPQTVAFLDRLLRETEEPMAHVEEIEVPVGSEVVGVQLNDSGLRDQGALVIAMHQPNGSYLYNPSGDAVVQAGSSVIVLGNHDEIGRLRELLTA